MKRKLSPWCKEVKKIIKVSTELEMSVHEFPSGTIREHNKALCELIHRKSRMKELPFTIVLELTLTEWPKGRHTSSLCAEWKNLIHHISQWNITMVA